MADLSIDSFVLRQIGTTGRGKNKKAVTEGEGGVDAAGASKLDVFSLVTAGELERTIEGASTLTVTLHDPGWIVLNSGILDRDRNDRMNPIDVELDDQWFRLVKVVASLDDLQLTFEDRAVSLLRMHRRTVKVNRDSTTRAEFVKRLVREVKFGGGIPTFIPELHEVMPVAAPEESD